MRYDYDLTGKKFGRLNVIKLGYTKNKQNHWECKCDCGNTTIVKARYLNSKSTTSCGCYRREYHSLEPYRGRYNLMVRTSKTRNEHLGIMSFPEFLALIKSNNSCHYCGENVEWQPHQCYKNRNLSKGGYYLDRKDNSIGYTKDNCVVCCTLCNMVKGKNLTYDEMLVVGKSITEVRKLRQLTPRSNDLSTAQYTPNGRRGFASVRFGNIR